MEASSSPSSSSGSIATSTSLGFCCRSISNLHRNTRLQFGSRSQGQHAVLSSGEGRTARNALLQPAQQFEVVLPIETTPHSSYPDQSGHVSRQGYALLSHKRQKLPFGCTALGSALNRGGPGAGLREDIGVVTAHEVALSNLSLLLLQHCVQVLITCSMTVPLGQMHCFPQSNLSLLLLQHCVQVLVTCGMTVPVGQMCCFPRAI